MALLFIRCPVCGAVSETWGEVAAARGQTQCGYCGLTFVPDAATLVTPEPPETDQDGESRPGGVHAPPTVVYARTAARTRGLSIISDATRPGSAAGRVPPVPPDATPRDGTGQARGAAGPLEPDAPVSSNRSIIAVAQPEPAGDGASPTPPSGAADPREPIILGPAPPYRPVTQAAAAFARGPAPDLEPWRSAPVPRVSETVSPGSARPEIAGEGQAAILSPERPSSDAAAPAGAEVADRTEYEAPSDARDRPVVWSAGLALAPPELGYAPPDLDRIWFGGTSFSRRKMRMVTWATGLLAVACLVGVARWILPRLAP